MLQQQIVDFLSRKYPAGPILRNIVGQPWNNSAVWWRMDSLKGLIAELHGTSLQMLQRHYKHLDGHRTSLSEIWAKAKGSSVTGSGEGRP